MPSRKQRRRRQKERRHEYEYVYVDEEGRELEQPPEEAAPRTRTRREEPPRRDGKASRSKNGRARSVREYHPPSWKRSLRRAALFLPLFFIVFSLVNSGGALVQRAALSLFYSALFVPLTYLMDRTAYRTYLRRSGGTSGGKRRSS